MEQKSMTALASMFARAYHSKHSGGKVFDDSIAELLLSGEEYGQIAQSMSAGIGFFNPAFQGSGDEALRWIVEHQLAPSPLGRAAFAEKALETAVRVGVRQYLILAAGYDTFAYRQPAWASKLSIFETDHPATAEDKRKRLARAGLAIPPNVHFTDADFREDNWQSALVKCEAFSQKAISFCSLLGIAYYLQKHNFGRMLLALTGLLPEGSSLVFDYPEAGGRDAAQTRKQEALAKEAGEQMQAAYSYAEMEALLSEYGFLIYEHLTPPEITEQYFSAYNVANPTHPMAAFGGVNYCLAVKKA